MRYLPDTALGHKTEAQRLGIGFGVKGGMGLGLEHHARQNAMSPNDACAAIYRDIMIGLNERYFSSKGENNTHNFPNMKVTVQLLQS